MTFTKEQLTRIIESADEVITALAGTNDDIHPDNSTKMCEAWNYLNDVAAPPSVVKRLAEMALVGMEAEPVAWVLIDPESGHSVATKAEFTLNFYRDKGWNIAPLYAAPQPLTTSERAELENYRNAQPDMNYQHLSELYHAQEKRLFKLAQRIKGPAFDKYAHSPSQAIDVLESAILVNAKMKTAAPPCFRVKPMATLR